MLKSNRRWSFAYVLSNVQYCISFAAISCSYNHNATTIRHATSLAADQRLHALLTMKYQQQRCYRRTSSSSKRCPNFGLNFRHIISLPSVVLALLSVCPVADFLPALGVVAAPAPQACPATPVSLQCSCATASPAAVINCYRLGVLPSVPPFTPSSGSFSLTIGGLTKIRNIQV